ncbi:MAG: NAD-dependent epimerase [Candidatus Raymondbacteria bacterium RIFOXYA2_FULL_49_16]|uniref:NAD-dependent epimerase n=1 Tax=Candidatus Raymondbacteria bacterium RIFOXYD12_FULL_49_13 TaxID=1817890 RepID=A0A1F7FCV8_UNCRA|nr:MAG: NAD-dependent epimerase [Candidatus Raymondbacteria bacterium RIFOXYA2_FULL_49_16]OGK04307.1 MAG: NAD-dependent epimerase [Candidatus Raymondbacteria bacterium RIFOXYD12_FULL_49_13]OGP42410.1 MAG: NAD-dependent epimerase [Candidatus Raymondbacteria bacterium RIFOXYB2_FULL_49_35]
MNIVLVSGSAGLIGSETVRFFSEKGFTVLGIDNNMRRDFFGDDASTLPMQRNLEETVKNYRHVSADIRDLVSIDRVFAEYGTDIQLVVHTAAQPSHDWAAQAPQIDFGVNANGTLNMLESTRKHCPKAVFIFTSTNKVYGDAPNRLPLVESDTRWEIERSHTYWNGINESMSIDQCLHSLFGVSKVAADVLVQEYGRYFGMSTGVFRGGCLTGPGHAGTMLHGFLSYLVKCAISGVPYRILGYKGKQVRDNIHSYDLVNAFYHFSRAPRAGEVYNMGGSRHSNCSILEAIALCEELTGKKIASAYMDQNRIGDHIWYISDVGKFKRHYPEWAYKYSLRDIMVEIVRHATT